MTIKSKVVFSYDVVCPYAYIGSRRIEELVERVRNVTGHEVELVWNPVLLGGLYKDTDAPQGKDGSATDVMNKGKKKMLGRDLFLQASRHRAKVNFHPRHPVKSLYAQRLLAGAPDSVRADLTHALYRAYWVKNENVDDLSVLKIYAEKFGIDAAIIESDAVKAKLKANTDFASSNGVFGVPALLVYPPMDAEKIETAKPVLFWGQDRMHFVEKLLGNKGAELPRIQPCHRPGAKRATIKFYFDFSSPWAFIGYSHLQKVREVADVEMVPILLGAIFRSVGTANLPALAMPKSKRKYGVKDMKDWCEWYKIPLRWPDVFPIRTVDALRIALVEPKVIDPLYQAAWTGNKNLGDKTVLLDVLNKAGFDGEALLAASQSDAVKNKLRENTDGAIARGVFGVPSYEIFRSGHKESLLIWGQDRVDTVLDIANGWTPSVPIKNKM